MLLYHIIQKHFLYRNYTNWDSVVGIETRYGLERAGLETRRSKRFSLLHTVSVMSSGDPHRVVCNAYHVPFPAESAKEWC